MPDLRQEKDDAFQTFQPAFNRRDFIKGVHHKNVMCHPVTLKAKGNQDKEEL